MKVSEKIQWTYNLCVVTFVPLVIMPFALCLGEYMWWALAVIPFLISWRIPYDSIN